MAEIADIVIVGAGATGLAFAWRLSASQPDLRILVIERGGHIDQRKSPSLKDEWELALLRQFHANPNIRKNPDDYPVDDSQTPIKPAFFNAVGGSTIRWGAHFPRFRPSDFAVHTQDGIAADWRRRQAPSPAPAHVKKWSVPFRHVPASGQGPYYQRRQNPHSISYLGILVVFV